MEVWILLAAAGSGYLARKWQNAQKPKGLSADEVENENSAGPSHNLPSSRGRYRRFSSSTRRQVGRSVCGKASPLWVRPKSTGNLMEVQDGKKLMGEEGGKETSGEDHNCNNADGCEICLYSRGAKLAGNRLVEHVEDGENENNHLEEGYGDSRTGKQLNLSCAGNPWKETQDNDRGGLECDVQEEDMNRQSGGGASYSSLLRSVSGKRSNDSLDVKLQQSGQLYQVGCAGKRIKDALDDSNTAKLSEGCVFESWLPGFWDVSEGVFVLDTESLLAQQGEGNRGSSSRRSRTPSKHGRMIGFRKKKLAGQKPMSSLESCLSAQLGEDHSKRYTKISTQLIDDLPKDIGKRTPRHSGSFASESMLYTSKTDFAIGLPSLSRMPSSKWFPSKARTPRISIDCKESSEEPFNPFACCRYKGASGTKWENRKGRSSSSMKGLLFNFGVGVGMMFTVMSNMREVKRLTLLLKEAESLIKDLEDELESKGELKPDFGSGKHELKLEQRQSFVANTLRKVKSATESLYNMQMILSTEPRASSTLEHAPSKDMSKLEAELEAELARMELSLDDGDNTKPQNGSSKLNGRVENLVHGDLTVIELPHELEAYSDEDSSNSSREDIHVRNYAVSPRALAKRLHEVLEAQQEQRICELEAELESLSSKLQAKEEEAKWLEENSRAFPAIGDTQGFSSVESKRHQGSLRKEAISLPKLELSPPNPSPSLLYKSRKGLNHSSHVNKGIEDKSTAFVTLGGEALEAYKEACDEFSKLSISCSDSTFIAGSRSSERHDKETSAQDEKAEAKHLGCSDGLEQVDLLSLAQDFYGGGDHELLENMPKLSKGLFREQRGPRRKSRIKRHPEPETSFSSSRFVDSSDDGTNDTSGSTPCSIKFMNVRTASYSLNNGKQGVEEAGDAVFPPHIDWGREIVIHAGVNTPNQDNNESIHPGVEDSSCEFLAPSKPTDWKLPDDSDCFSELDEHLGRLLINRIVERSRKGSPIVQDAQTVLAQLEKNEPCHASD